MTICTGCLNYMGCVFQNSVSNRNWCSMFQLDEPNENLSFKINQTKKLKTMNRVKVKIVDSICQTCEMIEGCELTFEKSKKTYCEEYK
ncbi:hypothetical protein CRYO30217_01327 [Parvicella tangerina]|uniref:Uncharacterized protein n=1 Tax=Parvicella tangerina TaxID=2829795 RepID=A0A916JLK9_9FLAO|nr:hypothetical protein CRYO30217_01327 [Parvicella tangerina]